MRRQWLLALALAGASIASAKTYSITLSDPMIVGTKTLKPGDYRLKLDGSKAIFFGNRHNTAAEAGVTVQTADRKFPYTAVESKKAGDANQIEKIQLGGTRMTIDFD